MRVALENLFFIVVFRPQVGVKNLKDFEILKLIFMERALKINKQHERRTVEGLLVDGSASA